MRGPRCHCADVDADLDDGLSDDDDDLDNNHVDSCLLDLHNDLKGPERLELANDNLFLRGPEVDMLEVDLEQLGLHVLELLDHDELGIRVATFESLDWSS